jgi:uncharacterized protein (TIGR00251 family)
LAANHHSDTVLLHVKVTPNAARSQLAGLADGVLHARVAAAPVEGRANRELIALLGRALGVSRSSLSIVKGHTSRNKTVSISGLSLEETIKRLSA